MMANQPITTLVRGRAARAALPVPLIQAAGAQHTAETILKAWLEGKAAHTIRSYRHDLEDFAHYLTRALARPRPLTTIEALNQLFKQSAPSAHEIALGFRAWMQAAHLAPSSLNRHLAALRSVSRLARMLGLIVWHLEVPGVRSEPRRKTMGPTLEDARRLLAATLGDTEADTRNHAILTVFLCLALRVSEVVGLDRGDLDLDYGTLWIKGKGRREKELVQLPELVVEALRRYLPHRGGTTRGPLLLTLRGRLSRRGDHRLTTRAVLKMVRDTGARVGLHVWCHGLRHTAITSAAELGQRAGLGLDKIRAYSRHKNIATLLLYVDEHDRRGTQATLANLIAERLEPEDRRPSALLAGPRLALRGIRPPRVRRPRVAGHGTKANRSARYGVGSSCGEREAPSWTRSTIGLNHRSTTTTGPSSRSSIGSSPAPRQVCGREDSASPSDVCRRDETDAPGHGARRFMICAVIQSS